MEKEVKLVEYGIGDFCKKVQEMFDLGYRFDFDSNENFPVNFGTFIEAGMILKENEVKPSLDDADVLGKLPIDTVVAFTGDKVEVLSTETVTIKPKLAGRPKKVVNDPSA